MISVQLSAADYIASQRLHMKWSKRRWIIVLASYVPLLCLGIAAAWAGAFPREFPVPDARLFSSSSGCVGTSVGVLAARAVLLPIKSRRLYTSHKLLQSPIAYSWDLDHFVAKSEYGNSSIPWSKFLKFKENKEIFLLYVSRLQFFCLPKRAFPSDCGTRRVCHSWFSNIGRSNHSVKRTADVGLR